MTTGNRLKSEKSPYLIQHADNPVEWFPWGEEAFEKAEKEDKPVFLSIGYATCHWCHVMAHESFEDENVAGLMNETFVNIKVDREERPDIDNTYMMVCQMLTGSGGWPLTIIMTPEKKPFYAATYIPKKSRGGRPGMVELIPKIDQLWKNEREKIYRSSEEIARAFQQSTRLEKGDALSGEILDRAYRQFSDTFDDQCGGFGNAPKFPTPHNLTFLLRYWSRSGDERALEMVCKTLIKMRRGGLFDQVGLGFHRYSTDRGWLVPHFEKMLYDQAMLLMAYTETWQATGDDRFKKTAEEIIEYTVRDLRDEQGGFYSAEDADSEGEEGKFYVWSMDEIKNLLSREEAELAIEIFNISKEGNYTDEATGRRTGKNILHRDRPLDEPAEEQNLSRGELASMLEEIRKKLYKPREKRERPLLDDKILTDWNGLMIAALAKAGNVFHKQEYISQAAEAVAFIFSTLVTDNEQLLHRYRKGEAAIEAHAEDYAFLIWGLLELYEAALDHSYLRKAIDLQEKFIDYFWDDENGGFFFSSHSSEKLLGRKKEGYDGALPSGNSVAMINLLRLGRITGNSEWEEYAELTGRLFSEQIEQAPTGFSQMLQAVDFNLGPSYEVTVAGEKSSEDTQAILLALRQHFIPNKVVVLNQPDDPVINRLAPYTDQQSMEEGKATAYVCRHYTCRKPTTDPEEMISLFDQP